MFMFIVYLYLYGVNKILFVAWTHKTTAVNVLRTFPQWKMNVFCILLNVWHSQKQQKSQSANKMFKLFTQTLTCIIKFVSMKSKWIQIALNFWFRNERILRWVFVFARHSTISSHLIESLCAYTTLASHCWLNIIYSLSIFICCVCLMPMHSFICIHLICFIVKFVRVPSTHHKIHATNKKNNRKMRKRFLYA